MEMQDQRLFRLEINGPYLLFAMVCALLHTQNICNHTIAAGTITETESAVAECL